MDIFRLTGAALLTCILIIVVKEYKPEFSVLVSVAAGTVITAMLLRDILSAFDGIGKLMTEADADGDMITPVVKAFGICVVSQLSADICRDSGQSATASRIELAGRLGIVLTAMPLFENILALAAGIINEG